MSLSMPSWPPDEPDDHSGSTDSPAVPLDGSSTSPLSLVSPKVGSIDDSTIFEVYCHPHELSRPTEAALEIIPPSRDPLYYLDTAIFEVENQPFVVLRHHFLTSNILHLYSEGPAKLDGVLKSEFEVLWKMLYSLPRNALSQDEWEAVLKMSEKLKMLALRTEAMGQLSALSITPLKRILLGREYGIVEWLRSGYIDLATQSDALSLDEFSALGLETALLLSQKVRRLYRYLKLGGSIAPSIAVDKHFRQLMDGAALDGLAQTPYLDEVDQILLAQSLGVPEWLYTAYGDLAKREEDITFAEAGRLGIETTRGLCHVREYLRVQDSRNAVRSPNTWSVQSSIDTIFWKELADVGRTGVAYTSVEKGKKKKNRMLSKNPV